MAAKSVLFDLDGTLWDSWPWYARVLARAGRLSQAEALRRLRARESIARLIAECRLEMGPFVQACAELRPFPGALDALARLERKRLPLGVVTSLSPRLALPMLEALGIEERFAVVKCAAGRSKARSILDAIRQMGLTPGASIFYVGDQVSDAEGAKRAGISFAWAAYGYGDGEPEGTDVVLRTASDIGRL